MEYEADPRQAEKLSAECGVEGANSLTTSGARDSAADVANDKELATGLGTAFRGLAARAN